MENDEYMDGFASLKDFIELSLTNVERSMTAQFDDVKATLQIHERRFDRIDRKLDEHDQRFDRIDQRVGGVESRLTRVETSLDIVQGDVAELKRDVRALGRGRRD